MSVLKKISVFLLALGLCSCAQKIVPQSGFYFPKENREKDKLGFDLVKNLMILPVTLNGVELSFLLDTGVEKTILFSLEERDSLLLKDAVSVNIRGLGEGASTVAFKSKNNRMQIGKAVNDSLSLFVVFNKEMNFSPRLGVPVHGIIGTDFFKAFVVEVDYEGEFIKFYEPSAYDKTCKNCGVAKMYFHQNNPYLKTDIGLNGKQHEVLLLVDTGLGGALWIFPDEKIQVPEKNFQDFLGLGLSGSIYGKRSKIESFSFGNYEFREITTAFPDSSVVDKKVHWEALKSGILGAEILKRFDLVIDYPDKLLYYKPNGFFDAPFHYNMSGLTIQYNGLRVVKDYEYVDVGKFGSSTKLDVNNHYNPTSYKVKFRIEPAMEIAEIRPNSPAERAGLKIGDVLLEVNGRGSTNYDLSDLTKLFSSEVGRKIKITIERNGVKHKVEFRLEKIF